MTVEIKYAYDVGKISFLLRRKSMGRLIIDGNRVYELDEACLQRKRRTGQMLEADGKKQMKKGHENITQKKKR